MSSNVLHHCNHARTEITSTFGSCKLFSNELILDIYFHWFSNWSWYHDIDQNFPDMYSDTVSMYRIKLVTCQPIIDHLKQTRLCLASIWKLGLVDQRAPFDWYPCYLPGKSSPVYLNNEVLLTFESYSNILICLKLSDFHYITKASYSLFNSKLIALLLKPKKSISFPNSSFGFVIAAWPSTI